MGNKNRYYTHVNLKPDMKDLLILLLKKIITSIILLFGVSIITFTLSHMLPTDPARIIAGPRAGTDVLEKVRNEYGLDRPVVEQFFHYLARILNLDFGQSLSTKRPVINDLIEFLPATFELTFFALFLAIVLGILVGTISAIRENNLSNWLGRTITYTGQSIPVFWLALLAQLLFYYHLDWLPFGGRLSNTANQPLGYSGLITLDSFILAEWNVLIDAVQHLTLPAFVLGFSSFTIIARITRVSVLQVKNELYVTAARAKGVNNPLLTLRHILLPSLPPIITSIGLEIGYMLGGSLVVETVFSWPGIGRYTTKAILAADYNAIMGVTVISAIVFLAINGITDSLIFWLFPQTRENNIN